MSSLQYLELIERQLHQENLDQIIMLCLLNLRVLLSNYLPRQVIPDKKRVIFDSLTKLLSKVEIAKEPVVDQIFHFLCDHE